MRSKKIGALCGAASLCFALVPVRAQETATPTRPATPPTASGLQTGPATIPPHWSKYKYPETIPEGAAYYIVVRGDTLWDISQRFLGNPFLWPQIWDQNRYITDAHWIYPGDPLILPNVALIAEGAGRPGGLPGEEGEGGLPGEGPRGEAGAVLVPIAEEFTMNCSPYIVPSREDESLKVIGSEEGSAKIAYAERDIIYLNKGSNAGVKAGDVYSFHKPAYTVRHPRTQRKLGTTIQVMGWGRVILVSENTATVVIEQSCADVVAGNYLKPFEKKNVPLILRHSPPDRLTPPTGKAQGFIVDMAENAAMAGQGSVISIDLGAEDGVSPGTTLTVYRIVHPEMPTSRNVLGELAIMTVMEQTATAKVIYSRDHMLPGDEVEVR